LASRGAFATGFKGTTAAEYPTAPSHALSVAAIHRCRIIDISYQEFSCFFLVRFPYVIMLIIGNFLALK
jgi:hypothetical protein